MGEQEEGILEEDMDDAMDCCLVCLLVYCEMGLYVFVLDGKRKQSLVGFLFCCDEYCCIRTRRNNTEEVVVSRNSYCYVLLGIVVFTTDTLQNSSAKSSGVTVR